MKKWILLGIIFLVFSCTDSKTSRQGNKTSDKVIPSSKSDTLDVTTQKTTLFPELTTDNAIPFLYEYEKENKERKVRIITSFGNIDIELYNETPYHRANFIFLTKQGYFDNTCFHRVVKNFVIQGGNSDTWETSRKRRKIGKYLLPPDTRKGFRHHRGTLSMPSSEIDNPHQFASPFEFFIVCQKPGAYHLDRGYTPFGKVVSGMDVVDKINSVSTDKREWPIENISMKVIILE